jgi:hypothetical protein
MIKTSRDKFPSIFSNIKDTLDTIDENVINVNNNRPVVDFINVNNNRRCLQLEEIKNKYRINCELFTNNIKIFDQDKRLYNRTVKLLKTNIDSLDQKYTSIKAEYNLKIHEEDINKAEEVYMYVISNSIYQNYIQIIKKTKLLKNVIKNKLEILESRLLTMNDYVNRCLTKEKKIFFIKEYNLAIELIKLIEKLNSKLIQINNRIKKMYGNMEINIHQIQETLSQIDGYFDKYKPKDDEYDEDMYFYFPKNKNMHNYSKNILPKTNVRFPGITLRSQLI